MTDHATICLQKTWPVIVRLVVEIACRISLSLPMRRADRLASLRLLRLAESLMRRWLVLTACQRPLQMRVMTDCFNWQTRSAIPASARPSR